MLFADFVVVWSQFVSFFPARQHNRHINYDKNATREPRLYVTLFLACLFLSEFFLCDKYIFLGIVMAPVKRHKNELLAYIASWLALTVHVLNDQAKLYLANNKSHNQDMPLLPELIVLKIHSIHTYYMLIIKAKNQPKAKK